MLVKKLSSNIRSVRRLKNKLEADDDDELFKSDKYFDKKMMVNYANQIKRTQFQDQKLEYLLTRKRRGKNVR